MLIEDAGALCLSKVHYWSTVVHHYELITTVAASPAAAAPRWVFRANFPKAIYQSVQSYSPQRSSYIFSSPGWGGERRCQEIGEAASRSTGAWPGSATRGSDGIISPITWIFSSYLSIRHLLHQSYVLHLHVLLIWTHQICFGYCDLWSGHCNYRGDGIGSSSSINVSNINKQREAASRRQQETFTFCFPSIYCSPAPTAAVTP